MKKIIKSFMCTLLALIIFCFSSFSASALISFTDAQLLAMGWHFTPNTTDNNIKNLKNYVMPALSQNSSFNTTDYFCLVGGFHGANFPYLMIINKNTCYKEETESAFYYSTCNNSTISYSFGWFNMLSEYTSETSTAYTKLLNFDFESTKTPNITNTSTYISVVRIDKNLDYSDPNKIRAVRMSHSAFLSYSSVTNIDKLENTSLGSTSYYCSNYSFIPNTTTEIPDNELKHKSYDLYGVNVKEVDKVGFLQWIEEYNKIEDIKDSGLDIANDRLTYLINFWSKYKGRPIVMLTNAPELLWQINLTSITFDTIKSFSSCLDNLYLQYQNYLAERNSADKVGILNPANLPHHQRSTSDTSLITDDVSDTIDISLLRDILRQIILLPDEISNNLGYLSVYLDGILVDFDRLLYYLDGLPDYVAYSIHILFSDDIQTIIDAINNISVSVPEGDTTTNNFIDVTIPNEKQTELNNFFNGWNTKFSDELNSKFPIKSQLDNLFTDFFEKCGVDTNSDGQVFEYVTYSSDLNAVNSDGSFGVRHDNNIKSTFLSCFDDADTSYLDNIVYSDDIPKLGIKINGVQHEIINFKFYAKYRQYIFVIISFILWFGYLYSLYKSLPSIVGRVSGVVSAFKTSDVTKGDDD